MAEETKAVAVRVVRVTLTTLVWSLLVIGVAVGSWFAVDAAASEAAGPALWVDSVDLSARVTLSSSASPTPSPLATAGTVPSTSRTPSPSATPVVSSSVPTPTPTTTPAPSSPGAGRTASPAASPVQPTSPPPSAPASTTAVGTFTSDSGQIEIGCEDRTITFERVLPADGWQAETSQVSSSMFQVTFSDGTGNQLVVWAFCSASGPTFVRGDASPSPTTPA